MFRATKYLRPAATTFFAAPAPFTSMTAPLAEIPTKAYHMLDEHNPTKPGDSYPIPTGANSTTFMAVWLTLGCGLGLGLPFIAVALDSFQRKGTIFGKKI